MYCTNHPMHLSGECPHERHDTICSCQLPFPAQRGDYPPHSEECCCNACLGIRADEKSLEPIKKQIERLASYIGSEIPGEPSRNEGAVDTAIRLLRNAQALARFSLRHLPGKLTTEESVEFCRLCLGPDSLLDRSV